MKILYIVFVNFNKLISGSHVRPYQLYKAFLEAGYDVELLYINNSIRYGRWKDVRFFFKDNKHKLKYNLCYIEPPTDPVGNLSVYFLLTILKIKRIPTGFFFRDAYWKYDEEWGMNGLRKYLQIGLYKIDCLFLRLLSIKVYFPSQTMANKFKFKLIDTLPPAGIKRVLNLENEIYNKAVYVGGLTGNYGGQILLEAFEQINKIMNLKLTLVCRKDEITPEMEKLIRKPYIELKHVTGEEALSEIYSKCDFAIIPRKASEYMNFSMPVKIFEYLSFQLPIVSTNCYEVAKFIQNQNVGIVVDDKANSIADAIIQLYRNPECITNLKKNIKNALIGNLWSDRVKKIVNTIATN